MILLADYIEGAVTIINTISQANNQDFPVAMAEDINLRDGTNVEDRLSGLKNYVHPTTPGYRHIPAGGAEGQILKYKDDGEAEWMDETNTEYEEATPQKAGLMSASDKTKLNGIANNANNYTHPTTSGNKHIPAGGSEGQILQYESDGTAKWANPVKSSYDLATSEENGLMSATDKEKLDGIEENANNYIHPAHEEKTSGFYKVTVDNQGHVTDAVAVAKSDITALGIPGQDTNTTYEVATTSNAGLMSAVDKKKLDGIAANANNYTHPNTPGNKHIPAGGSEGQILQYESDGTAKWATIEETVYDEATTEKSGLMSASDKKKLDGIASGATKYTHPSYTQRQSGLYKVTVDNTGHVSAVAAVTKSDITGLGIPAQDTTYNVASTSANGLMSATDKKKLDGIAANANNYTHPSFTQRAAGLYKVTVNNQGHVTNAVAVTKSDITALGIPGQDTNTTYNAATTSTAGLMSAADKKKLDGIAANANNYTHPSYTQKSAGIYKFSVDATGHVNSATAVTKEDLVTINPGLQIGFAAEAPAELNLNDLWIELEGGI